MSHCMAGFASPRGAVRATTLLLQRCAFICIGIGLTNGEVREGNYCSCVPLFTFRGSRSPELCTCT